MPKRIEMALPVPNKSFLETSPDAAHAVCTLWVHPPISPIPTLSAEAEPISKGWK